MKSAEAKRVDREVRFSDPPSDPHSSPQHSNKHALDLRHLRCSFGIIRSVESIGETIPPFEDMKKLSLGQPGLRHGDGLRFHKL